MYNLLVIHRSLLGFGDINTVASTIQTIEGYYPGSLSYRLNNPGNLTYAGQAGATPVQVCNPNCHQFASFDSYDDGLTALDNQIALDASRGQTIQQFINSYAPASDNNNPTSYAAQITATTGLSVNDPLSSALTPGASASADAGSTPLNLSLDTTDASGDSTDDTPSDSSTVSIAGYDFSLPTLVIGSIVGLAALWAFSR